MTRQSDVLFVADVGGTTTRLALVSSTSEAPETIVQQDFPSGNYNGFDALIDEFKAKDAWRIERGVFAVAGPVVAGHAELTNLGWSLDESSLRESLGAKSIRLLNDLEALAYAIPHLPGAALHTLQAVVPQVGGAKVVIAPGTGLGEAFLVWDGTRYRSYPSEGGHADFAPVGPLQVELLEWLYKRFEHVSYERVCSGRGLPNLYAFLKQQVVAPEEEWLGAQLAAADDATAVIVDAALNQQRRSALCVATLELFAAILAAEAGNAALRLMATGGVYLAGGMARRALPFLRADAFLTAYRRKGRLTELLQRRIPLHVITNPDAALLGAIHYAQIGVRG
jgi:glucokinase